MSYVQSILSHYLLFIEFLNLLDERSSCASNFQQYRFTIHLYQITITISLVEVIRQSRTELLLLQTRIPQRSNDGVIIYAAREEDEGIVECALQFPDEDVSWTGSDWERHLAGAVVEVLELRGFLGVRV